MIFAWTSQPRPHIQRDCGVSVLAESYHQSQRQQELDIFTIYILPVEKLYSQMLCTLPFVEEVWTRI